MGAHLFFYHRAQYYFTMKFVVLASAVVLLACAAPQDRGSWDPKRGDTAPEEEVAPWDPKRGDTAPEERKVVPWWFQRPKEEVAPWDPKRGDTAPEERKEETTLPPFWLRPHRD